MSVRKMHTKFSTVSKLAEFEKRRIVLINFFPEILKYSGHYYGADNIIALAAKIKSP